MELKGNIYSALTYITNLDKVSNKMALKIILQIIATILNLDLKNKVFILHQKDGVLDLLKTYKNKSKEDYSEYLIELSILKLENNFHEIFRIKNETLLEVYKMLENFNWEQLDDVLNDLKTDNFKAVDNVFKNTSKAEIKKIRKIIFTNVNKNHYNFDLFNKIVDIFLK